MIRSRRDLKPQVSACSLLRRDTYFQVISEFLSIVYLTRQINTCLKINAFLKVLLRLRVTSVHQKDCHSLRCITSTVRASNLQVYSETRSSIWRKNPGDRQLTNGY